MEPLHGKQIGWNNRHTFLCMTIYGHMTQDDAHLFTCDPAYMSSLFLVMVMMLWMIIEITDRIELFLKQTTSNNRNFNSFTDLWSFA